MFEPIILKHPSGATATVCRYGAHITSWKLANGEEQLFLSELAEFKNGASIRGGVPIIFPQFNTFGTGLRHGFARTSEWRITQSPIEESSESIVCCELQLTDSDETQKSWPHKFLATYRILLSEASLRLELIVKNTNDTPCEFTAALHTYFCIPQLLNTRVTGLQHSKYWNNNGDDFSKRQQENDPALTFKDAIDRVYFDVDRSLKLQTTDNSSESTLNISQQGFSDVVIWNPGKDAAITMKDFVNTEYENMLCIEAAKIDSPVVLNSGDEWMGVQTLVKQ